LEVEGVGSFLVDRNGPAIYQQQAVAAASPEDVEDTILGPVLILALALLGTWSLHASAAALDGEVVAFVGESGNGKSTLAAWLDTGSAPAWRRIADDILPVEPGQHGVDVLPHFPQLKLPPDAQPSVGAPERMPVRAIYLLNRLPSSQTAPQTYALSGPEASLALARHTVAARLFDKALLANHMEFCSSAAGRVPVRSLGYAHDLNLLPVVQQHLETDLQTLP
jgi:hypothetical protein